MSMEGKAFAYLAFLLQQESCRTRGEKVFLRYWKSVTGKCCGLYHQNFSRMAQQTPLRREAVQLAVLGA